VNVILVSFRKTPTYGNGTIRKFGTITSKMKRKAARDYEDLLQVRLLVLTTADRTLNVS
jgi:hypothetical protein